MKLDQAKAECERWFAHIKRQKDRAVEMQKLAAARRSGEIDAAEATRRLKEFDTCSVSVFDGANLEKAVRVLLKHVQ